MASTGQPQSSLKRPNPAVNREGDKLAITPLGAGNEVGWSCFFTTFKGKTIMFDCGIHPGYSGMCALPYFDEIDPSSIDVLLVTQFKQIYESVESSTDEESGVASLRVHDRVTVKQESENHLSVHWTADPISDMVSDSVVALVLNASTEMPKVSIESEMLEDGKKAEKIVHALLVSMFGDVKSGDDGKLVINFDGNVAHLDKQTGDVECESKCQGES